MSVLKCNVQRGFCPCFSTQISAVWQMEPSGNLLRSDGFFSAGWIAAVRALQILGPCALTASLVALETLKCQSWQYKSSDRLYPDIRTGRFAGIKESSSFQLQVTDLTTKNRRQKGGWRWKALPWFFSFFWRKRCHFVHFSFNKLNRREIFCYFSARAFSENALVAQLLNRGNNNNNNDED